MKYFTKTLILTAAAVTIGLATSCKRDKKDNLNLLSGQALNSSIPVSDGSTYKPTILGDQLKNPFQVDTMRKAFKKLTGVDCQLPVTHKYVRFLPSTQE